MKNLKDKLKKKVDDVKTFVYNNPDLVGLALGAVILITYVVVLSKIDAEQPDKIMMNWTDENGYKNTMWGVVDKDGNIHPM